MVTTKDILDKYSKKIESSLDSPIDEGKASQDYIEFKKEMSHEPTRYEKWAKSMGTFIKLKVSEKDRAKIQKQLEIAHVDVTPSQAVTLATLAMLFVFVTTFLITFAFYLINGSTQILFLFLGALASLFVFYYAYTLPRRIANSWRLQASSQMVPAVLYVVIYMKHTSNLERAIEFASQHLEGPLALDFKKIFYDVEIGKFSTIKQSLDSYLESWQEYAPEFVESIHLVESSLYEPSEPRRIQILEKALQIILDGIYEKMLKYSREIRSPMTNVYMLGIILPTLGLALLPLASTLLGGTLQWQHVFVIFNVLIPFGVFYLTSEILLKRPGGYGETSVLELNPDYPKFKSKKPWMTATLIAFPILILGILPFIFQIDFLTSTIGLKNDYTFGQLGIPISSLENSFLFDFKKSPEGKMVGPFGLVGVLLSLLVPLSIALFFTTAYKLKTRELIKSRQKTKLLEEEFNNSVFQLGNRLGDGLPAEIAFGKVAESTQGQTTQNFFSMVNLNIQQAGMSLEQSIFDKKRGAIIYYPSALISTAMRILVESVKKGLQIAARSLMSISDYVKNIQKINQRLRDLLAEIVSDMKSNMTFLAPLLAGIVVGLASMITLILNKLDGFQQILTGDTANSAATGTLGAVMGIFNLSLMIPPYFIQLSIGLYLIEIMFILTAALVTIDSGKDVLKEKYDLSKNLMRGILLYVITAFFSIVALTMLAAISLKTL